MLKNVLFLKLLSSKFSLSVFIQRQAQRTEQQIRNDFKKLYQFLRLEEADRLLALRQEEDQKIQMIEKEIEEINNKMTSLSKIIRAIEEDIWTEDILFIQVSSPYSVLPRFDIYSQKAAYLKIKIIKCCNLLQCLGETFKR